MAARSLTGKNSEERPAPRYVGFCFCPIGTGLREAVAERFDAMLEAGALGEVGALVDQGLDADLPAMKAVGVRELSAALAGTLTLEEARTRAIAATRQYLKRQSTWLRHQVLAKEPDVHTWYAQYSYQLGEEIVRFLRNSR